jgi:pimeloyl-ACP methyl ester carboxylesterase
VNYDGENYMMTYIVGDKKLPKMVFIHGYGGSGLLMYKIFRPLSEHFHVMFLDLVGMGSSSRPEFPCKNGEEADHYMLTALEGWRVAMGNLTDFYLVGHSYGGYISGTYAALNPGHVKKLILLSPLGLKIRPAEFKSAKNLKFAHDKAPPKWAIGMVEKAWGMFTPFSFMRKVSVKTCRKMIANYVR